METKKYFGYWVRQRTEITTTAFFVFWARSKDLKTWIGIRRTREVEEGNQRILRPARTKAINYFLSASNINTIPSNIILAFPIGKARFTADPEWIQRIAIEPEIQNNCNHQLQWGSLQFEFDPSITEDSQKPAFIVDGQHRLFGISSFESEDLPLLVVALIDADNIEQAFHFIVVNNKQVKVPTDNIKSIIADIDEAQLEARVLNAGVKFGEHSPLLKQINDLESSPFKNLLTWDYNRERTDEDCLVPVTAIEQSLKYIQETFTFLNEDSDSLLEMFITIWNAIKDVYSDLWNIEPKFMKKVNIAAINEQVASNLKGLKQNGFIDIFNMTDIQKTIRNYYKDIPSEFWKCEWSVKIQDNSNIRKLIQNDIATIKDNIQTKINWKDNLELICLKNNL